MGDRVLFICKSDTGWTPAVYAHWEGENARKIIEAAIPRLRAGDEGYSIAAIAAAAWNFSNRGKETGYVSVSIIDAPADLKPATLRGDYNHGDAGVWVIDVEGGVATQYRTHGEGESFTFKFKQ